MNLKKKTADFLATVFPSNKSETVLFAVLFSIYGVLAFIIAQNYRIVFDNRIPWDAYFSFDNRAIVMTGGGFERHPLSNYFFGWIRNFAFWCSGGKMDAIFRTVLALCSAVTVSLSLVQIFKYLKNIIQLPLWISVMIVIFFSLFSTNILLSFTPETYTYTLFLLCLFNYYSALKIRKDEKIPAAALTLATIGIGGLTITNAAKVFIPVVFEKNLFKNFKNLLNAILRSTIAIGVFVLLYLYRLDFNYHKIFEKTGEQYDKFSKPKVTPLWDMIYSWFFGGNILFSSFVTRDYHNKKGFQYKALFMDVYSGWLPYVFVALVLILVLWSWVRNFRNKMVNVLMISLLFDVVIHCILKFGLHTSYIYGGHFVFVFPLMIGWLFYVYRKNVNVLSFLTVTLVVITVFLGANNIFRMQEFFIFLEKYYR